MESSKLLFPSIIFEKSIILYSNVKIRGRIIHTVLSSLKNIGACVNNSPFYVADIRKLSIQSSAWWPIASLTFLLLSYCYIDLQY